MADIPTPKLFWGNLYKQTVCLEKGKANLLVCEVKLLNDIWGFLRRFKCFPDILICSF